MSEFIIGRRRLPALAGLLVRAGLVGLGSIGATRSGLGLTRLAGTRKGRTHPRPRRGRGHHPPGGRLMAPDDSVPQGKAGDGETARAVFERFTRRLIGLARGRGGRRGYHAR